MTPTSEGAEGLRPVSLPWRVALGTLARLPQGILSRVVGKVGDLPLLRPLRRPVLGVFARLTGIDRSEAARPLTEYASVNEFFVRRLKPGARSFPDAPDQIVSPVDGVVGAVGRVVEGRAIQAKGRNYTVAQLLDDPVRARAFEGGLFVTVYLSPRHYHRIHTPLPGGVTLARHVPGRLFPVNRPAVAHVPDLFVVNERLVVFLETALGPVAVAAVGAYNVGRISAAFDPAWSGTAASWITNRATPPPPVRTYTPPIALGPGDELMAFHLGSTIVLLAPPTTTLVDGIRSEVEVRAGQLLATAAA